MSGYPLMSVLELRRREEEAALERLTEASRARAEAEAEDSRRVADVRAARQRLEVARQVDVVAVDRSGARTGAKGPAALPSGAATAEQARFVARRQDEVVQVETMLESFRSGRLTDARLAEAAAHKQHLGARQAREAFDKHAAKFLEARRRATERREEDAADDIPRAGMHPGSGQRRP